MKVGTDCFVVVGVAPPRVRARGRGGARGAGRAGTCASGGAVHARRCAPDAGRAISGARAAGRAQAAALDPVGRPIVEARAANEGRDTAGADGHTYRERPHRRGGSHACDILLRGYLGENGINCVTIAKGKLNRRARPIRQMKCCVILCCCARGPSLVAKAGSLEGAWNVVNSAVSDQHKCAAQAAAPLRIQIAPSGHARAARPSAASGRRRRLRFGLGVGPRRGFLCDLRRRPVRVWEILCGTRAAPKPQKLGAPYSFWPQPEEYAVFGGNRAARY